MNSRRLNQLGLWSASLYGLLLIPTLILGCHVASGGSVSGLITQAWQRDFLLSPSFLPDPIGTVVLDILRFTVIGALAWCYWQGYQAFSKTSTAQESQATKPLWLWPLMFSLLLIWVIPFHSKDLYGYINRGAEQAFYALNPYITPLSQIPGWQTDPMFHAHWADNPSPYGFFFTRLTQWVCVLSGHHFGVAFLLFKSLHAVLHLSICALLYGLSKHLNLKNPWLPVYLYGWNPLILLHMVGNGHNDLWVPLGILGAIYCLGLERFRWLSLPILTLSILTKYASLLVLPFILLILWRLKDFRGLIWGGSLSLLFVFALGWPYLQDWQQIAWNQMGENAMMSQHSLNALLARVVFYSAKAFPALSLWVEPARSAFKPILWGCFLLFCGWQFKQCWQTWRGENLKLPNILCQLIYQATLALILMITVASSKFHPWYLGMFFPLALLLDCQQRWPYLLFIYSMLLVMIQLLAFTPLQNIHILNYILLTLLPLWLALKTFSKNPSPENLQPEKSPT